MKKFTALLLAALLCLTLVACGAKKTDTPKPITDGEEIGSGKTAFTVVVTDKDAQKVTFSVHTDEKTVGAALLNLGVIAGENSEYGLYVKTVNGITADYDTDGSYWAFYIDGEYAMTGVDATDVVDGAVYGFTVETM